MFKSFTNKKNTHKHTKNSEGDLFEDRVYNTKVVFLGLAPSVLGLNQLMGPLVLIALQIEQA